MWLDEPGWQAEHSVERAGPGGHWTDPAALVFLPHTGHGLRARDRQLLQQLQQVARIVPVLGKAAIIKISEPISPQTFFVFRILSYWCELVG